MLLVDLHIAVLITIAYYTLKWFYTREKPANDLHWKITGRTHDANSPRLWPMCHYHLGRKGVDCSC